MTSVNLKRAENLLNKLRKDHTSCTPDHAAALFHDNTWPDLKIESFRGSAFTLIAQGIKLFLQIGSVAVLARILTPEDYGLFGIAMAVILFVNLFKDMGLPTVTIQKAEITHAQVSNLFWINATMGLGFALLTVMASPLVGWVYHEPRLVAMIMVMSLLCVANGFVSQPQAFLQRSMQFKKLAIVDVISVMIGVLVAIIAAWHLGKYWSLVYMHLTISVTTLAGTWWICNWRPAKPSHSGDIRQLLRSGRHLTLSTLLAYINRNLDSLLIGWSRGPRELGFYDKAYMLLLLPNLYIHLPVSRIALSSLSRTQNDEEQHRRHYAGIVLLTTSLGMGLIAFLFVAADKVILFILGSQWIPSVPLFRALAPAAFVDCFLITLNWVLISLGQTKRLFKMTFAVSVLTVIGFVVGLPWGALGVAVAFSACRVSSLLPMLIYVCRHSHLHVSDVLRSLLRPVFASIMAAGGLWLITSILMFDGHIMINLMIHAVVFVSVYLGISIALPGGVGMFKQFIRLVPLLWRGSILLN
jgi:O-antigen/teichoic acid export membrane protein